MTTSIISDRVSPRIPPVIIIGPNFQQRGAVTHALNGYLRGRFQELGEYPRDIDDIAEMLSHEYAVIMVELDTDPEAALRLIETITSNSSANVVVYSQQTNPAILLRCMHAGAREFISCPFSQVAIEDAIARAASCRHVPTRQLSSLPEDGYGGLFAFVGAKGGVGVTTVSCNFAVALAQESAKKTLLIDLSLPLGDAAIDLGIEARYSTMDALLNYDQLNFNFLSRLLVRHSSGLAVLAAPTDFTAARISNQAIDKLFTVAQRAFDYVVVDMGSRQDLPFAMSLNESAAVYLVTQVGIAELRNSNRFIRNFLQKGGAQLEIVINRYDPRSLEISEDQIDSALTKPAEWKIPNNYYAVRRTQMSATPLIFEDSPISRAIWQMTKAVCDKQSPSNKKKKGFRFFRS